MDKRVFAPTRASEWAFSPFGHTLSAQSIFRDVHAAAKNELNSIRGLRAAQTQDPDYADRFRAYAQEYCLPEGE